MSDKVAEQTKYAPVVDSVAAELAATIEGEVRFDDGSRALYATDASNYREVPIGVVIPKNRQDIINTVKICNKYHLPILTRGGGTSLAGQCCNVAVVMDISKYYNHLLNVDIENRTATVEPGKILDNLLDDIKDKDLAFGPDPATHNHCSFGGMIGNNSCGIHSLLSVKYGLGMRVSDNLEEMTVLTYDGEVMTVGPTSEEELENIIRNGGKKGEIYRQLKEIRDKYQHLIREKFPKIPRRVSGYNLDELLPENGFNVARALAGTEGTCVTYLDAKVKLVPKPKGRRLVVLGYPSVYDAGNHCVEILKFNPIGLEGLDGVLIGYLKKRKLHVESTKYFPEGDGWLLVEFGGETQEEADRQAEDLIKAVQKMNNPPSYRLYDSPEDEERIWEVRESGLGATAFIPDEEDTWEGWEDTAVHPKDVGHYLKDFRELMQKYDYNSALYGHFGQGCIHCRINFDLRTKNGIEKFRNFLEEGADLVIKYGGSYSGEHGDGQSRAELLEKLYGPELIEAFREFKAVWDPFNKMNPGKIVNPKPILSNLRLGPDYNPKQLKTYFKYPEDRHDFSRAALRCVGVGKCRRDEGGTMCPSYMVTKEEKHSTRGRARMLFEMLQGDVIKDGWKSEEVKESLDLCLACKGCKNDCPVNVDMATYKSEFFAHYYKRKMRPLHAYAFGFIAIWSRMASKSPRLVNFLTNAPILGSIMKKTLGMPKQRKLPKYARETFKAWFAKRPLVNKDKPKVILWPDTFNNYFHPESAKAAVEVLEHLGYRVEVPMQHLCCGRPLYDYGFLDTAKAWLKQIVTVLREDIRNEVPIVGLEPSCVATFRDEIRNLFPTDKDALRLSENVFILTEFMEEVAGDYKLPKLGKKALLHVHCHHKSILRKEHEQTVLEKLGMEVTNPDSGCCGMAGAFGYEESNYKVSVDCGERVLLPAVREAAKDNIIVSSGFSCREQIRQQTSEQPLHISEVIKMALKKLPLSDKKAGQRGPEKEIKEIRKERKPGNE